MNKSQELCVEKELGREAPDRRGLDLVDPDSVPLQKEVPEVVSEVVDLDLQKPDLENVHVGCEVVDLVLQKTGLEIVEVVDHRSPDQVDKKEPEHCLQSTRPNWGHRGHLQGPDHVDRLAQAVLAQCKHERSNQGLPLGRTTLILDARGPQRSSYLQGSSHLVKRIQGVLAEMN